MTEVELTSSTWVPVHQFGSWTRGINFGAREPTTSFCVIFLTTQSRTLQSVILDSTMNISTTGVSLTNMPANLIFLRLRICAKSWIMWCTGIMLLIEIIKPQVRDNSQLQRFRPNHCIALLLTTFLYYSGNHADFNQFVGSRPYVFYYHLWLLEIPHLSFLAVPQLSDDVFRMSASSTMTNKNKEQQDEHSSSISNAESMSSNDEVFTIDSQPPPEAGTAQRKRHGGTSTTPSCSNTASISTIHTGTPGRDTMKMRLLQSHLQSLEKHQVEAAQQRKNKDERDQQMAWTVELKAVEELLVMKKSELKAFDSDVDSESEKEFVCQQIKKLRKKQRSLTALAYGSDNDVSI